MVIDAVIQVVSNAPAARSRFENVLDTKGMHGDIPECTFWQPISTTMQ